MPVMGFAALALRVVGAALIALGAIQFMLVGKSHHDRSGNAPLTPTFRALPPDLMGRADRALKVAAVGAVLFGLSLFL
jgi:hypothetical protein